MIDFSSDTWKVTGEASQRLHGAFQATTFPDELGPWKQTEFVSKTRAITDYQGAQSSVWTYRSPNTTVLVHINYPFLGWHNLPSCFEGRGWNPIQLELANSSPEELEVWQMKVVQSHIAMQVLFCQFDRHGQPVQTITGWRSASWSTILRQGVRQLPIRGSDTASYQVVMQVTTEGGNPEWSAEQLVDEFIKIRHRLMTTIAERLGNDR